MNTPYDWANVEATIHKAFMKLITINTLRRPKASAREPQMYAPAIIPIIYKQVNYTSFLFTIQCNYINQ